jgi:hypothetical protein
LNENAAAPEVGYFMKGLRHSKSSADEHHRHLLGKKQRGETLRYSWIESILVKEALRRGLTREPPMDRSAKNKPNVTA